MYWKGQLPNRSYKRQFELSRLSEITMWKLAYRLGWKDATTDCKQTKEGLGRSPFSDSVGISGPLIH